MSASHVSAALRRFIRERAGERCEYCLIPEELTWALHTIDHITSEKHGGRTTCQGLTYLKSLPKLNRLDTKGCGLDFEALDDFQVACPAVKIE